MKNKIGFLQLCKAETIKLFSFVFRELNSPATISQSLSKTKSETCPRSLFKQAAERHRKGKLKFVCLLEQEVGVTSM